MFQFIKNILDKIFSKKESVDVDNYRNGLIKSPTDFRDINIKQVLGSINLQPLPENYRIPYSLPIYYQGIKPICVGESCATIKNEKEARENNETIFDGEWIYNECKKIDGIPDIQGTYFRTGLQILQKVGAKPLSISPVQGVPATFKIGSYVSVDTDFESLKRAIIASGAILLGFYGDDAGWQTAYIKKPKTIQWGHAVSAIGFTKDYIIFQNSWGDNWGDKGLGYISKDYLPFEAWAVLTDLPTINKIEKPIYTFKKNLSFGMSDPDIIQLQRFYKWNGCMALDIPESAHFGNATLSSTKIYQQRKGIKPVSGFVGTLTLSAINKELSE